MVDQATDKTVKTQIEWDDPIQAMRTYRGGVLNDCFEIVELLASRGTSTVYSAIDRRLSDTADRDIYVTIKILKRKFKAQEESILTLQKEVKKAQHLDHPNIIKLYGLYRDEDMAYLVTERFIGESLSRRMDSGGLRGKSNRELLQVINEMGKALAYAHEQGVVHGDFQPANVIVADKGEIKVIDFGLARVLYRTAKADSRQFSSGRFNCSTPGYASPETLESQLPDPRDDVFALACTSYELLTGEHPFQRMRASSARDAGLKIKRRGKLTGAQWLAFQAALEFDRKKRTPTVDKFLTALNAEARHRRVLTRAAAKIAGVVVLTFGMVGSVYEFKYTLDPAEFAAMETEAEPADSVQDRLIARSPIEEQGAQRAVRAPQDVSGGLTQAASPNVNETEVSGEVSFAMKRLLQTEQQKQERPLANLENQRSDADPVRQVTREIPKESEVQQPKQNIARLLALARAQFAANRLTLPAGENALETYQQVLQAVPDQRDALVGIDKIKSKYRTWALHAQDAGAWRKAEVNLKKAQAIDPHDAELAEALRKLTELRNTAELATRQAEQDDSARQTPQSANHTARRSNKSNTSPRDSTANPAVFTESSEPVDAHTPDVTALVADARQHLFAGRLIQPKGENAWEVFSAILDKYPGNPEAQAGLKAIPQELEAIARKTLQDGKLEEALRIVKNGLKFVPGHSGLLALKEKISGRLQGQRSLKEAEHTAKPAPTRSETPESEQDEPVEKNNHHIRSYGSFF